MGFDRLLTATHPPDLQDIAGFAKHLKDTIAMFENMGELESSFDLD